jgi:hypothetical protein
LTYSVAQSEADDKTKCDRHGNLYEQGWTFKNSTKGIILSRVADKLSCG